jgi:predicted MPP superfamily phosphohydrolase
LTRIQPGETREDNLRFLKQPKKGAHLKHSEFVVFIALALVVYFLINFLIFSKTRQFLIGLGWIKTTILCFLVLLILSFPLGRLLEALAPGQLSKFLIVAGSVYLGVMAYAFLMILLGEFIWLLNRWMHFLPSFVTQNSLKNRHTVAWISFTILFGIIGYGYLNALFVRVRTLDLRLDKPDHPTHEFRIAVASDLHLGILMNRSRLQKIIEKINWLDPDLVLFAGDLVDEDAFGNVSSGLTEVLRLIRSKNGVYAVTGNHEYYAGLAKSAAFIKAGNIQLLEDSVVTVADRLCLIGRKDMTSYHMGGGRKPLSVLADQCDRRLPLILVDHQPFRLEEAEKNGIDFQISGHTHHGQLFPFNWITKAVYEVSWGYLKKGKTQYWISCGAGTWGPPIRTGSISEILDIRLNFRDQRSP